MVRFQLSVFMFFLTAATPADLAWIAVQSMIKQLSEYLTRCLPGFWRVAKACMDGKYRRVSHHCCEPMGHAHYQRESSSSLSTGRRPASAPRSMALDIIKTYSGILSQYFTLSDFALAEAASKKDVEEVEVPPFIPAGTTVLAACFYAEKIVEEVSECAADLGAVEISSEAGTTLRGLLDSLRWRFEEVIAATWARGE